MCTTVKAEIPHGNIFKVLKTLLPFPLLVIFRVTCFHFKDAAQPLKLQMELTYWTAGQNTANWWVPRLHPPPPNDGNKGLDSVRIMETAQVNRSVLDLRCQGLENHQSWNLLVSMAKLDRRKVSKRKAAIVSCRIMKENRWAKWKL